MTAKKNRYPSENLRLEPENTPLEKEKHRAVDVQEIRMRISDERNMGVSQNGWWK